MYGRECADSGMPAGCSQVMGEKHRDTRHTAAHNSQGLLLCTARWSHAVVVETPGRVRMRVPRDPEILTRREHLLRPLDHWTTGVHVPGPL